MSRMRFHSKGMVTFYPAAGRVALGHWVILDQNLKKVSLSPSGELTGQKLLHLIPVKSIHSLIVLFLPLTQA